MNTVPIYTIDQALCRKMYWKILSSSIVGMGMKLQLSVLYYFYMECLYTLPFPLSLSQQVRFLTKIYHPNIDKVNRTAFHLFSFSKLVCKKAGFILIPSLLHSLEGYVLTFLKTNGVLLFKSVLYF